MSPPLVSGIIFLLTFAAILAERVHRTIVALTGALAMVVAGLIMGFYSEEQALQSLDLYTLGLLLGMMALVRMLENTGFFEYLAIVTAKRSRGTPWLLLIILGTVTAVASMFLDNVTTVVFMVPVTIIIAEIMGLRPVPFLIAEVILSNVGGVATLVGDPPNILIGSAADLSFIDFVFHLAPPVFFAWLVSIVLLTIIFRKDLFKNPTDVAALLQLDQKEALKDPVALKKILIVLTGVVIFFFIEHLLGVSPALVALGGLSLALIWTQPDVEKTLESVEWNVLVFFAALFVLVGGLDASGVLDAVARTFSRDAQTNPLVTSILILWGSALLSAVVDNIPLTIVMIPIIQEMALGGVNVTPLWWALAIGAGFGGNGTPIGSTAGVIALGLSAKTRTPLTTPTWLRSATVVMVVTCLVATVFFVLAFDFLSR
ncbi:MAG: ArsB/NhaD family transporter [Chloroflexi bacterium]|nr:ArsB/NhaD family transporter [Chloroflexota bacterium]